MKSSRQAEKTLSVQDARRLFETGQAILDGAQLLTTHYGDYEYDQSRQAYDLVDSGLRVNHRGGCRWRGGRFVRCDCQWCERLPEARRAEVAR